MTQSDATDLNTPALGYAESRHDPSAVDYRLLVVTEGKAQTHRLGSGIILIGRAEDADIQVDSARLSRRHIKLHVGDRLLVEDCNSSNGTFVRGIRLSPGEATEIDIGDTIDLADSATLVIQASGAPSRLHRLWPHGYFEARLEEECARAVRTNGSFTLLRMSVPSDASVQRVEGALAESFRMSDIVARYSPDEYEVLISDADEERASAVCERLRQAMARHGVAVGIGTATYPKQGRSAQTLITAAEAALHGTPVTAAEEPPSTAPSGMNRLMHLVGRIATSPISIILQGETGVGKEVMARRIHALSERRNQPFITVNCGALAETLLESELFGHEKGSFTGATTAKTGLLEAANEGTIFLDEVGEMPVSLQVKLLRVLEAREVLPVGGVKPRPIDVRVLAATNRNLEDDVRRNVFRQDLFFRLNGITLTIPPLRERVEEIEELATAFLQHACATMKSGASGRITPDAMAALKAYWWPGNIRELKNAIERAVVLSMDGVVDIDQLPVEKMGAALGHPEQLGGLLSGELGGGFATPTHALTQPPPSPPPVDRELREEVRELERNRIIEALTRFGGNQTRAARELGIARGTLVSRMEEYNIPRPRKR